MLIETSSKLKSSFNSYFASLYKKKIEDLVTIRKPFFIFIHGSRTYTHSIGSIDPIQ